MKLNLLQPKIYLSLIYICFASIFLLHYLFSGQAVYGDGIGYYSYLHSWYFDSDNDFTNEYKHIYNYENNNEIVPRISNDVQIVGVNSSGKALNHFSPGMAILLMPFYILSDAIVVILNSFGASFAQNGYSDIYQIVSGLGAIGYVTLGVWLNDNLLKIFGFKSSVRYSAILVLLFATNLLYYGPFDVLNSHFASFFLSSLFFLYFFKHKKELAIKNYFLLGLIIGLMTITRPQDGVIATVVLANALILLKTHKVSWPDTLKNLLAFSLPIVMIVTPLIIQWIRIFDSIDSHPYFIWLTNREESRLVYNLVGNLFHKTNGLFTRTPIIFVSVLTFFYLAFKKKLNNSLKLFFVYFFFQYLIISLQGGWRAAAYGGRMYISSMPFFLFLIAKIIKWIENKYSNNIKWIFIFIFIFINILSIFSFILFEKEASNNGRGIESYTLDRIERIITTILP